MSALSDYIANNPVPPMPPHGSADPDSPSYNPERGPWMDANPGGTERWQAWFQGRERAIDADIRAGRSEESIHNDAIKTRDPDNKNPLQDVLDYIRDRGWLYGKGKDDRLKYGHMTPWTNPQYPNARYIDDRENGSTIYDENGMQIGIIPYQGNRSGSGPGTGTTNLTAGGLDLQALLTALGIGPYGTANKPKDRPELKRPSETNFGGWGSYFGQTRTPTNRRVPGVTPGATTGLSSPAFSATPSPTPAALPQWYIPGLSRSRQDQDDDY